MPDDLMGRKRFAVSSICWTGCVALLALPTPVSADQGGVVYIETVCNESNESCSSVSAHFDNMNACNQTSVRRYAMWLDNIGHRIVYVNCYPAFRDKPNDVYEPPPKQ
jgi:hypothetical protein